MTKEVYPIRKLLTSLVLLVSNPLKRLKRYGTRCLQLTTQKQVIKNTPRYSGCFFMRLFNYVILPLNASHRLGEDACRRQDERVCKGLLVKAYNKNARF